MLNYDLHEMIRNHTIRHDRKVKKICSPLRDCLGIDYFSYYTIGPEGEFTFLSNYPEQIDYFFYQQLYLPCPYFIHPELLQEGFAIVETTPDPEALETIEKRFGMRKLLLMIKKNAGSLEGAIFLTKQAETPPNHFFTHLSLLKKFGTYFKKEAGELINKMHSDGYSMEAAKGASFFECSSDLPLRAFNEKVKKFMKSICPLSRRERECLELYSQGYSSKETAQILGISFRTVEYYFENMKNKLGCFSKRALLQK